MFNLLILLAFVPFICCADLWYKDCSGPGAFLRIDSLEVHPYPLKYPGSISFSPKFEVLQDIPDEDAKLAVSLDKLNPKRMNIPCINGFGSCEVNYCADYDKTVLKEFGFGKCPLKKGQYSINHPSTPLPNFGSIFDKVMEGDFEGNVTYYNGKTKQIYSCLLFKLSIELSR